MPSDDKPVLILGGGINGAALARDLVLNKVPVILVDKYDLASGSTAHSSRLIHGGLRYLEHAELKLVRESLAERERLLQLAPHLVCPLKLRIPIRSRGGGIFRTLAKFVGLNRRNRPSNRPRGLLLVRLGLWLYDLLATSTTFPKHRCESRRPNDSEAIDRNRFPWLCHYHDAQMRFPERFVMAMLKEARDVSEQNQTAFEVLTYHDAQLRDGLVEIHCRQSATPGITKQMRPSVVVNASGAWIDRTLSHFGNQDCCLVGGTKGSHVLTFRPELVEAVGDAGIYAEASDGRPVFLLPLGAGVLIGTTDLSSHGDPADVRATEGEINYLLDLANELFSNFQLKREDVVMHCSGVRPLPFVPGRANASVTRSHCLDVRTVEGVEVLSMIGGKLTTCRSFAEEVGDVVLDLLGRTRMESTATRVLQESCTREDFENLFEQEFAGWASNANDASDRIKMAWGLLGTEAIRVWKNVSQLEAWDRCLHKTNIPQPLVVEIIRREWVTTLEDLVERRLMLPYGRHVTKTCIEESAALMVLEGKFAQDEAKKRIASCIDNLKNRFGRKIEG